MRGRLLVLAQGPDAADQSITLPLVGDAATTFGPTRLEGGDVGALPVVGSAAVAFAPIRLEGGDVGLLPLIGDAAVAFGPTRIEGGDIRTLPLVGSAASTFAPTLTFDLPVSVPVVGNVATPFAPRVVSYVAGSPTTPVNDPDEVVLTLHSNNGTLIRTLSKYRSFRFGDPLKVSSPGHGELVLKRIIEAGAANPSLTGLDHDTIIRCTVGGDTAWQMLVEDLEHRLIGPGEEADEVTVAGGRHTVLAELDKVRVYPDAGLGLRPWSNTRWFNYSADDLVDDAWGFAFSTPPNYDQPVPNYGRPEGFPDFTAQWIWDRYSGVNVPGGDCYFRHRFTVATACDALVIFAADDEVEVWIDGVPILNVEGVYKGGCVQAQVELSAASHLIAARGRNLNALHAGILGTVMTVSEGMPDTVLTNTQASTWRVLGYPTKAPGFTPTQVIRQLVSEAQARGELTGLSMSFLTSHDTDGEPVASTTDIAARHGDSYLTVCGQLGETLLDIAGSSTGKTLHAWNRGTRGTNVAASYTKGTNLLSLVHESHTDAQATVALVQYAGGAPFERTHADVGTLGRKGVSLEFGDVRSLTLARALADAYLNTAAAVRRGVTAGIEPTADADRPYRGVWPGDSPMVPAADLTATRTRVAGIGLEIDASERLRWSLEFEKPGDLDAERMSAIMRRQLPGSAGGRSLLPSKVDPTFIASTPGRESRETWSANVDPGVVVLRKNGTAIPGATVTVAVGTTGKVVITDSARRFTKKVDKLDFTIDGVAGFPELPMPDGRFIQEMQVTGSDNGVSVTLLIA